MLFQIIAMTDRDYDVDFSYEHLEKGHYMDDITIKKPEETLDPDDWEKLRHLGHQMVDDMFDYLKNIRQKPVWRPVPESAKEFLEQPLPQKSQDPEAVYRDFAEHIFPNPMGNIHPRFWGWVIGTGTPLGVLAEMLAACMNPNLGGGDHVANYVEKQVLSWSKEMLGYPSNASGLLVSGGSMANMIGLTIARNAGADVDLRRHGLQGSIRKMTLYGSTAMHNSIKKAIEVLGLGNAYLREIPVDSDYAIDINALQKQITRDRASGYQPFCVVGNLGTVNTGAFDDINALADVSEKERLWLHLDGAFGALAALSPALRHLTAGIARADSLAFDFHKWMYMPLEIGCVLVRHEGLHLQTFSTAADYLTHGGQRGLAAGSKWFSDYGVQLSRGFKALKAWMSIKAYGIEKYRRLIEQNVAQARYLARIVDAHPELERLAPVPLNIVCFRYNDHTLEGTELNVLNQEILLRLHESGIAVPTYTTLNGRYALRAAITNHRSRREDFDLLVQSVVNLGKEARAQITCMPHSETDESDRCWFGQPD